MDSQAIWLLIIIIFYSCMKPTLANRNLKSKPSSMYQEYRSRTKSQLDCSQLLSGISQLDSQMSRFDELRKQRLSQSFIIDSEEQPQNMRSSMRLEHKPALEAEQATEDNLLYSPLVPILEYQKVRPSKPMPPSITAKSMIDSKFNKDKMQPPSVKTIQADTKMKDERKEKVNALKTKTKQLQQEFLQAFSNDILKKSTINKEFAQLLKLLQ